MKKAKKLISAMLFGVMLVSSMSIVHAGTDPITIDSIIFSEYTDSQGATDDSLINVTVGFTAVSDADQISVLLTSENISEITDANQDKIIYIDQIETPEDGTFSFVIDRERVKAATGSDEIDGSTLYMKMGGTNVDTMASKETEVEDPANSVMLGDVDGDEDITSWDAVLTLRYEAGWVLTDVNEAAMDVDGDEEVTSWDAVLMLRYEAGWTVSELE